MLLSVVSVIAWNKWRYFEQNHFYNRILSSFYNRILYSSHRMTKQLGITMFILYGIFVAQDLYRGLK